MTARPIRTLLLCLLLLPCTQCGKKENEARARQQERIQTLVHDEETVLDLTLLTGKIAESIKNKQLLNPDTRPLFAEEILLADLLPESETAKDLLPAHDLSTSEWTIQEPRKQSSHEIGESGIWSDLLASFHEISDASFGFVSGQSNDEAVLNSLLKFSAKGVDHNGNQCSLQGKVAVDWTKSNGNWIITKWHTKSMTKTSCANLMFENSMADLFSPTDHQLAIRSFHEEKLIDFIRKDEVLLPKIEYGPYFQPESGYQHPAVSVVDINNDGWDDLFVTSLWAPCQLWINDGGKRFTERASDFGLDVSTCCTSAIFADFDNDGDPDLILGRSLERSRILWNESGFFVPSSQELPYLVTSISTADCNQDGLLDIYLCTYGPNGTSAQNNPAWMLKFLPLEEQQHLNRALAEGHPYFDQAGPRNLLLLNRGQRQFDAAPAHPAIDQYHNSYQGTWADYDQDGDVDLYVCNDFAPDSLLRNEGSDDNGIPRFTDVSKSLSDDTMKGFGMGASWGDFNNDQKPDLFVTNMYSKAGHRILSRFENVDDRLHFSARGNLLFKQSNGRFKQLAGQSDAFPVHEGGWAFGGQFIDIDNDAWQDLYVPNGFYTAPKPVASEVDL